MSKKNDSDSPTGATTDSERKPSISREVKFLATFLGLLAAGFISLSLNAVNDNLVVPFTGVIAKISGWSLDVIGQDVRMNGTQILSDRFAVDIQNGCNGLETVIIFVAAVLAFPAPLKARGIGLALGVLAIQAVNLVRVVALFLTGAYFPAFFDSSHTVVWQTIVIAFGVLLWLFWANRFALPPQQTSEA